MPPAALEAALDRVSWDPARRGPLLVLDPANTEPAGPATLPSGPCGLRTVAPLFDRKIVRLPTLTVLVPRTMVVVNARPARPDFDTGLGRDKRLLRLLGALDAAQWRKLGSALRTGSG